jgi:putative DNA primase/helicase
MRKPESATYGRHPDGTPRTWDDTITGYGDPSPAGAALVGEAIAEAERPPGPRLRYRTADTITPQKPDWMWLGWLVRSSLHLMIGRQGSGKSTAAAWLGATVSQGRKFPGDDTERPPGRVAMLSLEETGGERLTARLTAAGADLTRCLILEDVEALNDEGGTYRRPWRLPVDCSILETLIREQAIDLVIVDGLGHAVDGDSHRYEIVAAALAALASVAERTKAVVCGITHPPKGNSDPVTAAIGSTAWTAMPRVCFVIGIDPNDDSGARRVLRVSKTNYREPATGFSFTIGDDEQLECGFVTSLRPSDVSAEDLVTVAEPGEKGDRAEARDFLRSALADGSLTTEELLKLTKAAGISERTVRRARADLGVVSRPRHDPRTGRMVGWIVELLDHTAKPQGQVPQIGPVGRVGRVGVNRTFEGIIEDQAAHTAHNSSLAPWSDGSPIPADDNDDRETIW